MAKRAKSKASSTSSEPKADLPAPDLGAEPEAEPAEFGMEPTDSLTTPVPKPRRTRGTAVRLPKKPRKPKASTGEASPPSERDLEVAKEAQEKIRPHLEELELELSHAKKNWDQFESNSKGAWEDIQTGLRMSLKSMQQAFEKAKKHFPEQDK